MNNNEVRLIDARKVYDFLNPDCGFTTWMQDRIQRYGFTVGVDYLTKGSVPGDMQYSLTLRMAKQLTMLEDNDQGKKMRLYFIDCEDFRERMRDLARPRDYFSD